VALSRDSYVVSQRRRLQKHGRQTMTQEAAPQDKSPQCSRLAKLNKEQNIPHYSNDFSPAMDSQPSIHLKTSELQAQSSESLVENETGVEPENTSINSQIVADSVYQLMKRDLILERERSISIGGQ